MERCQQRKRWDDAANSPKLQKKSKIICFDMVYIYYMRPKRIFILKLK